MRAIILLFVLLTTIGLCSSYKWAKDKIANPINDPPPFCGLAEKGPLLCDPDQQLDHNQHKYIFNKQNYISHLGECPCAGTCNNGENGVVFGFLFIKEYEGDNSNEVNPPVLHEFADYVRKKWDLGTCDNSILITIATEPKQYAISVGERATQIVNDTWLIGILEENFRERNIFNLFTKVKDILFMYEKAIEEELKNRDILSTGPQSSSTDSSNSTTLYTILILCILIFIIIVVSMILFVVLRHRKENDDVSLRDVWSKKFWTKAGKQYKEAKQSETNNEKDIEKNEDEEVKAKLASTEDLKPVDDIDNENVEYPGKLSKI